ncbi:MAG: hypothetical protein QOE63_110, partial [Acidimicrobiaceae bacterium]
MAEADLDTTAGLPAPLAKRDDHPFVGREREMAVLGHRLAAVAAGRPQLVALAGEPGIGKTRLARRFARVAHASGTTVLFGRCDEEPLERYQPFVEALRDLLTAWSGSDLASLPREVGSLSRLLPELASQLPPAEPGTTGDAETERYRLFEAVSSLLRALAADAPLVLVLDDIHWADRPTLLLLRHVLRAPGQVHLLVLATYRDTDVGRGHPLGELLADLRREEGLVHRVDVSGLDDESVFALLEQLGGHPLVESERQLARQLRQITGGNSFFIREIVRHFVEVGALRQQEDGHWVPDDAIRAGRIPDGVSEVVMRRVGRLSTGAQRALVHASVIGREFDVALLAAITGTEDAVLVEQLEEALEAQLLREAPGTIDQFTFAHAIVRDALYATVSMSRRVRLHRAVGTALELRPEGERRLTELARHFAHAPDAAGLEKAAEYARRAGDEAMGLLAYEAAAVAFTRALAVLDRLDAVESARTTPPDPAHEERRAHLLLQLGNAQSMASDRDAAARTYREAAGIARRVGATPMLSEAALGFAGMLGNPGEPDAETVRLLEEALALETVPTANRAHLLTRLASELMYSPGEHRRALATFEDAVDTAQVAGDGASLIAARWYRRVLAGQPVDPAERIDLAEETLALAESLGDAPSLLSAHGWLLVDHLEAGRIHDARADIDAYGALVQQLRMPYRRGFPTMWRSTLALLEGRLDDADVLTQEALAAATAEGDVDPLFFSNWSGQLFALRLMQGRLAELREVVELVVESKPGLVAWRVAYAYLCHETGDIDGAEQVYRQVVGPPLESLPFDGLWLFTMCLLTDLALYLDDRRRYDDLERLLRPFVDRTIIVGYAAFSFGPVALR